MSASTDVLTAPDWLSQRYPQYAGLLATNVALAFEGEEAVLSPRMRELVAIVTLAYLGNANLDTRMRLGLEAGASLRDILEALFVVATPGGQLCLANGLRALAPIVTGREEGDALGPPEAPVSSKTVREVSPASPWPWLDEKHPEYQAVRRELNDLTFMPVKAALEPKYRELLVGVVLSCRSYPTVPQHFRRAVAEGATLAELFEAINVASLLAGQGVSAHASPFLQTLHLEFAKEKLQHPK
jgi:alkylhydroperoxidase/carboxymuconolactone decarboxylase family protein YurZ